MNAGYVRLSRDDDRRNYSSIENQKLIIRQYAARRNLQIDRWYEDDGVSGYVFDRPGFQQLMKDLEKDIDTVLVKDFSRLGRHNAKILLLLDELQEKGKHLIVIDDHYDSEGTEDDMIGITTWFNERYIKDTSRKIRHAIHARQEEGTLVTQPPFGYRRSDTNKEIFIVVPREADVVKQIYNLYMQGLGYRKIAACLTKQGTPTPSMMRRRRELEEGRDTKRRIAFVWSDGMVKEILDNDFYTGTLRLRKRARATVHGRDKRVPKNEQMIFEKHHPPVIDKMTFDLVQEIKAKRAGGRYRGSYQKGDEDFSRPSYPFGSCLYCRDCGGKLTPVRRQTTAGTRIYYICSTYNTRGKRYCSRAHLIEEQELMTDVVNYIRMCQSAAGDEMALPDGNVNISERELARRKCEEIQSEIAEAKNQLRILFSQKIKEIASNPENEMLVQESYDLIQRDLTARIHDLTLKLEEQNQEKQNREKQSQEKQSREKQVRLECGQVSGTLEDVAVRGALDRKDVEILIDRIEVDENGLPEIKLRYGISKTAWGSDGQKLMNVLNHHENQLICMVMELISRDGRGFTSAQYLSKRLSELGYPQTPKSVLPYIEAMTDMGLIKPGGNRQKPYMIMKNKEEIEKMIQEYTRKFYVNL